MNLHDILKISNGEIINGNILDQKIGNIQIDSRKVEINDIFICIKGKNDDGHNYIKEIENKCSCIIVSKDVIVTSDVLVIKVDDTISFMGTLSNYIRLKYINIPLIAITGSVGKTTTKELLYHVLNEKYKILYTKKNYNNNIGVPMTIFNLNENYNLIILEMGMNHLNEITLLSKIAKPTIAVITNIGTAHIGNLGSRENILKAKLEILDGMKEKRLIINNDNDLLHEYSLHNKCITVGINNKSDYMGKIVDDKVYFNDKSINLFSSEVPFVLNSLLAYACGSILNISFEDISDSLSGFILEGNRLNLVKSDKGYTIINDSYNASYDSVKLSIDILSKYKNRRIFVFADILELGDYSKDIHINIGKLVKESNIDMFICVGKNSYYSYEYVKNNSNIESYHFNSNSEAYDYLNKILNKDDIVLFKGSNAMKLSEIVNKLLKCN